jgi:Ca2+-binding EF-hand superfamily protein
MNLELLKQMSREAFLSSRSQPFFETEPKLPRNWKKMQMQVNMQKIEQYNMRKWMKLRGKKSPQQETVQRKDLRQVFEQLDKDRSGTLCLEELYEPLLSLGLVESRAEVEQLIEYVGNKNSGIIEFHEFLRAFDSARAKKHSKIDTLLRDMEKNIILNQKTDLPFNLCCTNQRRNLMLKAYLGENGHDKDKGLKVLRAYALNLEKNEESPSKLQRIIWRRSSDYAKIKTRIAQYKSKLGDSLPMSRSGRLPRINSIQKTIVSPQTMRNQDLLNII